MSKSEVCALRSRFSRPESTFPDHSIPEAPEQPNHPQIIPPPPPPPLAPSPPPPQHPVRTLREPRLSTRTVLFAACQGLVVAVGPVGGLRGLRGFLGLRFGLCPSPLVLCHVKSACNPLARTLNPKPQDNKREWLLLPRLLSLKLHSMVSLPATPPPPGPTLICSL